jgi:hypothetical protein
MSTIQEEFPQCIKLLYLWPSLLPLPKKNLEATKAHDLRLHPDKLRARVCPRLHIQKPIEGHASSLLDAPEETQVTCTCSGSSEFSPVQRNNTIRHISSLTYITSNSSSVDTATNQERVTPTVPMAMCADKNIEVHYYQ